MSNSVVKWHSFNIHWPQFWKTHLAQTNEMRRYTTDLISRDHWNNFFKSPYKIVTLITCDFIWFRSCSRQLLSWATALMRAEWWVSSGRAWPLSWSVSFRRRRSRRSSERNRRLSWRGSGSWCRSWGRTMSFKWSYWGQSCKGSLHHSMR